jgi:hypothetical protein
MLQLGNKIKNSITHSQIQFPSTLRISPVYKAFVPFEPSCHHCASLTHGIIYLKHFEWQISRPVTCILLQDYKASNSDKKAPSWEITCYNNSGTLYSCPSFIHTLHTYEIQGAAYKYLVSSIPSSSITQQLKLLSLPQCQYRAQFILEWRL